MLINNGQFATMTDYMYVFLNLTSYTYRYCLDTIIAQILGQVNAGIYLNTAAVDTDIITSTYTTSLLF